MKRVYLDNAATTPMLPEVIDAMVQTMSTTFGNPSSTHAFGRNAKGEVENARKNIAKLLHCTTSEIVFTSGGTEADNLILKNAVNNLEVTHIVTSKLEHHAVLNTVAYLETKGVKISYVNTTELGTVDYKDLEHILNNSHEKTLVSLMYINNEIGTILELNKVNSLCKQHNALFHTDAVQAIGHFAIDLEKLNIDFLAASAHKFHGPKGIGFAYLKKGTGIRPEILGGEQERGSRAGTENTAAIVGMEKALSIAIQNLSNDVIYLKDLKNYFLKEVKEKLPTVKFNGFSHYLTKSSHTIVSIQFNKDMPMLLFQLDLKGIAVSGGSACQSGANKGSHVLQQFLDNSAQQNTSIRLSFSKLTTKQEVDYLITELVTAVQ